MPVLERPAYLTLLLLLPALAAALRFLPRPREARFPFSLPGSSLSGTRSATIAAAVSRALFWISLTCACLAATGPALVRREIVFPERGRDVVFVIDTSPSMSAMDFGQSRFDVCRGVLREFAEAGGNASLGLVAFGSEAALVVPPTEDRAFFLQRLDALAPGSQGDGTAIGMGIATAVFHLRGSRSPSRQVIVFTDGENNSGAISPLAAAALAADTGVALAMIGVGSRGEVRVSWTDPGTGKEMEGSYSSDFDETRMEEIAGRAGGSYLAARDADAMEKVKAQVLRSSSPLGRSRESRSSSPLAPILIAAALIAFLLRCVVEFLSGEASPCP